MAFSQTHRTGYECAKAYYARDLKELGKDVKRRFHFCHACSEVYYFDYDAMEDPKTFACPGSGDQCHCLYRFEKQGERFVKRYFCSLECAAKAKRTGKRVWYDDSGRRQPWDLD